MVLHVGFSCVVTLAALWRPGGSLIHASNGVTKGNQSQA